MESKKIDERVRLKGEPTKHKVTLYMEIDLHKSFKKVCDSKGFSLSEVVEELVREYLEDAKRK